MKQVPPLERARDLFALASSEYMFDFLEKVIRLNSLMTHPLLQRKQWDSDVYEHLQAESESLQKSEHNLRSFSRITYANSVLRLSSIGV